MVILLGCVLRTKTRQETCGVSRTAPLSKSRDPEIRTALLSKSANIESALFPPHLRWAHYLVLDEGPEGLELLQRTPAIYFH